jgi:hypothetical protein
MIPRLANPTRAYTQWLNEDWNYIRFVNPGDLRVAAKTCGTSGCHSAEVRKFNQHDDARRHAVGRGALQQRPFPLKTPRFGESYGPEGTPQRLLTFPPPTPEEISKKSLPYLDPRSAGKFRSRATSYASSNGAAEKPEVGIQASKKSRAGRRSN